MKISTRVRYAVRTLLDVAENGDEEPVSLREVSVRQEISLLYLQQLVRPLIANGLVRSVRGPNGGLVLLKPTSEIRLGDIFQIVDGKFSPVDCVADPKTCPRHKSCAARDIWIEVKVAVDGVLNSTTLEDLVKRQRKKGELDSSSRPTC